MKRKKAKMNSIRTKLIAGIMTICIIPLIVVGIGSYYQSKTILNDKLMLTSTQTLNEINDGVNEYFDGLMELVSITASNSHFIDIDSADNINYIQDILDHIQDNKLDLLGSYFGTESGKYIISPQQEMPAGYDATQRPWYQLAVENRGNVVLTSAYLSASTDDIVITVAKTVEKDNQIVGVMAIDCTLSDLTQKISQKKIGNNGYVFITDTEGIILAHPQSDLLNTDAAQSLTFWNDVKSQESGFVSFVENKTKQFGLFQTNSITGWKLVAILDDSELTKDTRAILVTMITMILIMLVISSVLSLLLSGGIARNIIKLKEVFAKASAGDLTVDIMAATNDEFVDLAQSFNKMIQSISELIKNIMHSSETVLLTSSALANMSSEVTSSVGEVARAIEEVSHGALNQAQDAQNAALQMESLSNKLDEIHGNSNEMDDISKETKLLSSKGLGMVDALIEKSNKTRFSTEAVNNIIDDMYESTKKISDISDTLSSITNQTNLLSLNASIESARAGEAGKGFAVVAAEIRKLAEESHNSTEEIKQIIEAIQKKSEVAVEAIQQTKTVVAEQDVAVVQTKDIFSEIMEAIGGMMIKVEEIKGSEMVTNNNKNSLVLAIENISSVSEETASASEEVTASTEEITASMEEFNKYSNELQELSNQLKNQISRFKIN